MATNQTHTLEQLLRRASLIVSFVGVMLAFLVFWLVAVYLDYSSNRDALFATAEKIRENVAVAFQAGHEKQDVSLQFLENQPTVELAALFRDDGTILAQYARPEQESGATAIAVRLPRDRESRRYALSLTAQEIWLPILHDGSFVGHLFIRNSLDRFQTFAFNLLVGGALLSLVVAIGFYSFTKFLLGRIAVNVERFTSAVHNATKTGGMVPLSLDTPVTEVRALAEGFNSLVAAVRDRDHALNDNTQNLERIVAERTHQLVDAKEAAEGAARAKTDFMATMSHEIRTPMNGVLGMTQMLQETKLDDKQQMYVDTIQKSGQVLLSIINDILDFSKIEAGKLHLEQTKCDLYDVVSMAGDNMYALAHRKGLELYVNIDPRCPRYVVGDAHRLSQVVNNLVSNAVKFTETGWVTIELKGELTSGVRAAFSLVVRDTGIGIQEGARAQLFEAFSQADASTTRKYGGTGLGLAICKRLVQQMGGELTFESEIGRGTAFYVNLRLPSMAADKIEPVVAAPTSAQVASRDPILNTLLYTQLKALGVKVRSPVETSASSIGVARPDEPCKWILINVNESSDLASFVPQALQRTQDAMPVLLVATATLIEEAEKRGIPASRWLQKPVTLDKLRAALADKVVPAGVRSSRSANEDDESYGLWDTTSRRLLLVEDIDLNRQIAANMLASLGMQVDHASNGAEAVAKYQNSPYDLILMDCNMPGMDGYEATRQIREIEKRIGRHVPIIALTANALEGDREKCLSSGMDDFLSKPLQAKVLRKTVAHYLTKKFNAVATQEFPATAGREPETLNRRVLDQLMAQMSQDDGPMVIANFDSVAEQMLRDLKSAIDKEDRDEIRRLAHSLKSTSAYVGAELLAEMCKALELHARYESREQVIDAVMAIHGEFRRVKHELEVWRAARQQSTTVRQTKHGG